VSSTSTEPMNAERLLFYIEITSSLLLLAYTVFVVCHDYGKPGQAQYFAARFCQRLARTFGAWGLAAEVEYHRILETERMI
jgi:hypothetical protein